MGFYKGSVLGTISVPGPINIIEEGYPALLIIDGNPSILRPLSNE
jgi:hypothetical protein